MRYFFRHNLLSLLNFLCNTTQRTSVIARDACYGCFFRAGSLNPGLTQLQQLEQCASLYLNNTNYGLCITSLRQQIPTEVALTGKLSVISKSECYNGYCSFVRCIRMTNTNLLITQCFDSNIHLINSDRVQFYINTTKCILNSIKCNQYNPITGEYQPNLNNSPLSNSIQISMNGEIRIITFPFNVRVKHIFCSSYSKISSQTDNLC